MACYVHAPRNACSRTNNDHSGFLRSSGEEEYGGGGDEETIIIIIIFI